MLKKLSFILFGLILWLFVSGWGWEAYKLMHYHHVIDRKITQAEMEIKELQKTIKRYQNNAFLKKKAIEDFNFVERGALVFIFAE